MPDLVEGMGYVNKYDRTVLFFSNDAFILFTSLCVCSIMFFPETELVV